MKKRIIIGVSLLGVYTMLSIADKVHKKALIFSDSEKDMIMLDTKNNFVMPPAEALANSINRDLENIDWSKFIKSEFDPKVKFNSNMDRALLLGMKGADAYFLALSKKSSELKNISMSINFLLNKIKIDNKSINDSKRKSELKKLATKISQKKWSEVLIGISRLKDEISSDFKSKNRDYLDLLNSIGGWLEGYRLAVEGFKVNYKADATITLLQDSLLVYLLNEIKKSEELKKFPKKSEIVKLLTDIHNIIINIKGETVSKSEIEILSNILSKTTLL